MRKSDCFCPFRVFFAAGSWARGGLALLMQFSLILWPFAVRWARQFHEARAVQRALDQLAATYRREEDKAAPSMTGLRQMADLPRA